MAGKRAVSPAPPPPPAIAQQRSSPRQAAPSEPVTQARRYTRAANQLSSPSFRNYQGIVLAEFVLAELLVAATPIATRQNMPGLSPYIPRDMTKLLSIGLLFFLLELMSAGGQGPGRLAAWLGGLVLLAVGLNEGANVTKDLDLFAGLRKTAPKTPPTEV